MPERNERNDAKLIRECGLEVAQNAAGRYTSMGTNARTEHTSNRTIDLLQPTERRFKMKTRQLLLRVPLALDGYLLAASKESGVSVQTIITDIVARHYGLKVDMPRSGRPRKVPS